MIRRFLALLVGAALACVAGEVAARALALEPRLQVVRGSEVALDTRFGAPTWLPRQAVERRNEACQGRHLVVLGSSILYGSGLDAGDVFSAHLDVPGLCVHNLAASGFDMGAKLAALAAWEQPVDEVWLEVWDADPSPYTPIGDDVWRLPLGTRVDDHGVPDAFGLPFNTWLFRHSHLFQVATASTVPVEPVSVESAWSRAEDLAVDALRGRPATVLVAPRLDRPFDASVQDVERAWATAAERIGERSGARVVDLAQQLVDLDHLELRADPCCHFNAAGHRVLAERLGMLASVARDTATP